MESGKSKLLAKPIKSKQTPQHKKKKSKRLTRIHTKAHSHINIQELISGFEDLDESRAFYINLKENQIMNLFSAIRLKGISAKRRYKALIQRIQEMQDKFKAHPVCRVVPSPRYLPNISPITVSESHFFNASFSSSFENKNLVQSKPDLIRLLDKIQFESCVLIESNCLVQERLKLINSEKVEIVMKVGNLFMKKQELAKENLKNLKKINENKKFQEVLAELKGKLQALRSKDRGRKEKSSEFVHSRYRIRTLQEIVTAKKSVVEGLKEELSKIEKSNLEKENYLKELLLLKQKILQRAGMIKEFENPMEFTKRQICETLNSKLGSFPIN